MGSRSRIVAVVLLVAALAAAAAVAATLLTSDGEGASPTSGRLRGSPPLALDLGPRDDAEARLLRRAARLYARGRTDAALRLFRRSASVPAQIGVAFAHWPDGTLERLERLAADHPESGLVHFHRGVALFWSGRRRDAVTAWRTTERNDPDSPSAVRAGNLLHPNAARGLPTFVPSFRPSRSITGLPPARQLPALRRAAERGGVRARLLYGVALQRVGRPVSAARVYASAAALAPRNAEAQVAAAVGRFSKADPSRAFSRLGPLTRRFPRAVTVRFHLGLLLLWIGEVRPARQQLERARALAPASPLGRAATQLLGRLEAIEEGR